MSDYEEEHFPVGIRTSFSSTFDADWRDSAGLTDFVPIRRSFSEFYRGECMTVDTNSHPCEFQNVTSKEEIQNFADDDDSDLDSLNVSTVMNLGSGMNSSCITATENSACSDVQRRSFQPEFDMQIDSLISEHCSANSDYANCYHSNDANSGTKVNSRAKIGEAAVTVGQYDSLSRTGLSGKEFAHSQPESSNVNDVTRHRAVSEIRNNIPDVGSVKSCSDSASEIGQSSPDTILRGEFAHFRKRSPGVAKRLEATTPSHSESVDLSVLGLHEVCEVDEAAFDEHNPESCSSTQPSTILWDTIPAESKANVTVIGTDSTEGRCIAKDSTRSRECNNVVVESSQMWESLSDDSARRSDPFRYSGMLPDAVLFTTSDDPVADQTIRLSPELTECDSDNVSTLEEDITVDVVDGCLPAVEDGLSCSDTDELHTSVRTSSPSNFSSATQSDTALDSSIKFPVSETEVMDFFSGTADSPRVKDDAVERAIRDIRLAMERSKRFSAGSPAKSQQSAQRHVESVWVSRAEWVFFSLYNCIILTFSTLLITILFVKLSIEHSVHVSGEIQIVFEIDCVTVIGFNS